ncbi:MAG: hypothetical protein U0163_17030 [Gemmatimonadaceae bacterium]
MIDVQRLAAGVLLTPWDRGVAKHGARQLGEHGNSRRRRPHEARLTFAQPGRIVLMVRGWQATRIGGTGG